MSFNNCSCGCRKHRCRCHRELFECHNRRRNLMEESTNIIIINSKNVNVRVAINQNELSRIVRRNRNEESSNW